MDTIPQKKGRFVRGVAILSSGALLAMVISIIAAPITSRLFPPEAFGIAAIFASFSSVLGPLGSLRYDKAVQLPRDKDEASSLLVLSIILSFLTTLVLFLVIHIFGVEILTKLNAPELIPVKWWIPVGVFIFSLGLPLSTWVIRQERFETATQSKVLKQASVSGLSIVGGAGGFNSGIHLTGLRLIGQMVVPLYFFFEIVLKRDLRLGKVTFRQIWIQLKRHWKFPVFSTWDSLFESAGREAPVFVMTLFFTQSLVGNYSRAILLVGIPFHVLGMALEQVFYQQASKMHSTGVELKNLTKKVYKGILAYTFAPFILLAVVGPELFQFILGDPWRESGVFAALIAPFVLAKLVFIPIATVYNVYEKQGVGFLFTMTLFVVQVSALVLGGVFGSARLSLAAYSISGALVMSGLGAWSLKIADVRLSYALSVLLKVFLLSTVTILPSLFVKQVLGASFVWVMLTGLIGLAAYYLLALWRDHEVRRLLSDYFLKRNNHE